MKIKARKKVFLFVSAPLSRGAVPVSTWSKEKVNVQIRNTIIIYPRGVGICLV